MTDKEYEEYILSKPEFMLTLQEKFFLNREKLADIKITKSLMDEIDHLSLVGFYFENQNISKCCFPKITKSKYLKAQKRIKEIEKEYGL